MINSLVYSLAPAFKSLYKNNTPGFFKANALSFKSSYLAKNDKVSFTGKTENDEVIDSLIIALKDNDPRIRNDAAMALGKTKNTRAVEPLIHALKDRSEMVRASAAFALGNIGDARAIEPLTITIKDKDFFVRDSAALALGNIETPEAIEALITALIGMNKEDSLRPRVIEILVAIGKPAVDPLITALKDKNYIDVIEILGNIRDSRAIDSLSIALENEDPKVRMAAAIALGEIGDARAMNSLSIALSDTDNWVWAAAKIALTKLKMKH
jgi:HEAT repeat protein